MPNDCYHGIDNLEVLADAVRYNRFLVDAVVAESRGCGVAVDFGAGTGSLSKMTRDRGLQVTCVELDPHLRRRLRDLGFEVYENVDDIADHSLEFIYSLNVLEHIEDDEGTLTALFSKLRPGGRFLLYVPALQVLYSSMDRKIGHYRRYHKQGLLLLARRAGFAIDRAEYADSMGFFVTLLYKIIGSKQGDVSGLSVRIYDRFLFPISRGMDRIGCSRLFGKNLLVVMRRPRETSENCE